MSNFGESDGLPIPEEILGLSDSRGSDEDLGSSGESNGRMGSSYSGQYNNNGNSSAAMKRGLPKLREILRRQRPDSEVSSSGKTTPGLNIK